jgi:hypothetical protein
LPITAFVLLATAVVLYVFVHPPVRKAILVGSPNSVAASSSLAAVTSTYTVDSDPPGGTLLVDGERIPLPTSLRRASGTVVAGIVVLDGYNSDAVSLEFGEHEKAEIVKLERRDGPATSSSSTATPPAAPHAPTASAASTRAPSTSATSTYHWNHLYVAQPDGGR